MTSKTYVCTICHHINHASRYHCSACGTIPASYSWCRKPIVDKPEAHSGAGSMLITVAHGAQRLDSIRQGKSSMRTVPLDYYAEV